jgi:peptidoglycan/LPS O-acetylase OafA/YrhL
VTLRRVFSCELRWGFRKQIRCSLVVSTSFVTGLRGVPGGPTGRIRALDGVRGLAILAVLLFHFGYNAQSVAPVRGLRAALFAAFDFGWLGVDLFFVLSGFLISRILLRSKDEPHYFRSFYMRRALRIFPAYYAVLIIAFVVLPLAGHPMLPAWATTHQAWIWLYGTNIPVDAQWIDLGHLWTLAVEEHFYLFWPFVVYALPVPRLRLACLLTIPVALTVRVLGLHTPLAHYSDHFTLGRIDSLAIGALLATYSLSSESISSTVVRITVPMCFASIALLTMARVMPDTRPAVLCFGYPIFAGAFGGFVYLASARALPDLAIKVLESPILESFGKYSYGIYLFHLPLQRVSPGLVRVLKIDMVTFAGKLEWIGSMIAVAYTVAFLSWNVYERQFLRLRKYFGPAKVHVAGSTS